MSAALKEAEKAYAEDEVPIGAVIVHGDKIIARAYNQVERLCDATAHAELVCITSASSYLGSKYLPDCVLYATIEPCMMCAGAIFWSKVGRLVYGAADQKAGYFTLGGSIHPKTSISTDVMSNECLALIQKFFLEKRKLKASGKSNQSDFMNEN